ncbi:type II secretion system protein [Dokdonia sp.]|uniref:type II secretion system protein n=1 Tax=Dokdonia sp. TaxID=2024995 RepID=UPI0032637F70
MKKAKKILLKAYSLTEILIVLCIIGIIIYLAVPDQTSTISRAKAIEAQNMLNMVYGLEKSHFYRYAKYSSDFDEIGFEQSLTTDKGGLAIYKISIIEASSNTFKAQAVSIQDLDGDGQYNTWEIDQDRILKETIRD